MTKSDAVSRGISRNVTPNSQHLSADTAVPDYYTIIPVHDVMVGYKYTTQTYNCGHLLGQVRTDDASHRHLAGRRRVFVLQGRRWWHVDGARGLHARTITHHQHRVVSGSRGSGVLVVEQYLVQLLLTHL